MLPSGRKDTCPICNFTLISKFCKQMDREFGCKEAFGCTTDKYGHCITCPLAMAILVSNLMDLKNLSMGDAFRLCLRQDTNAVQIREILREALKDKKYYPKRRERNDNETKS